MNTQQIIEQSQNIFRTGLELVSDNLYKAKYPINDVTAGIYYLKFGTEITEDYFDELQYKYLAEEFYNQEETLKWNIYLLFVNSKMSDELKIKILKDNKYARKLVFSNAEFIDYFKLEKSEQTALPDIVSEWKDDLNKVGLQELYNKASIESIIRNFLNDSATTIKKQVEKSIVHIPNINKINSINLKDSYRKYPQGTRDFHFGSVNLFTGSNGVGKTSVLESIELVLTGDTQRNEGKKVESPNSITAILNDNISDEYVHNVKKYKERGIKWYNRRENEQGNNTYKSFNQFNFFNTDAAQQFSNSNEWNSINESLKEIVLGEEYTTLKAKTLKVYDRLKSELRKTSDLLENKKNNIQTNKKRLDELRIEKNFEALKENIKYNISNLKYKNPIDESNYSLSTLFINEINNELEFILNNKWLINYDSFIQIKEKLKTRISIVSEKKNSYNANINNANKLISERLKNENILVKANRFLKYIEIGNSNNIEEVELSNEKYKVSLQIINTLKDLTNLQLDIYNLKEEKSLITNIQEKEESLNNKRNSYNIQKNEIDTLQNSFNQNQKLINQLRNLGKEILNHSLHNNNCPLCDQQISKDLLLSKLENEFSNDNVKKLINEKNDIIIDLLKDINSLETEINSLKHYQSVISNSFKEYESLSIKSIYKLIDTTLKKEEDFLALKESNDEILSRINAIEGSVSEFSNLRSELSQIFQEKDININENFENIINDLNNEIRLSYREIDRLKSENIGIIESLNNELKLKDYTDSLDKIEEIVKSNETLIESVQFSFDKIKQYIEISYNENIIEISKKLSLLKENLNSLEQLENNQKEIKKLLSVNYELEESLPKEETLKKRLNKAVFVLKKISESGENSILQDFFDTNLNEIKDIFKTIHSPQEFTDIKFEDKKLVLFKEDDVPYEISQISTGQRGALVLSIFISLNRKLRNGPKILIFDDPVTFIDDFNALSFLDFLRYFIVKEKKQIFFATANKKFASLFKKKFEFLGENEFKEFELER
jgi:exonuclease SbcC